MLARLALFLPQNVEPSVVHELAAVGHVHVHAAFALLVFWALPSEELVGNGHDIRVNLHLGGALQLTSRCKAVIYRLHAI